MIQCKTVTKITKLVGNNIKPDNIGNTKLNKKEKEKKIRGTWACESTSKFSKQGMINEFTEWMKCYA